MTTSSVIAHCQDEVTGGWNDIELKCEFTADSVLAALHKHWIDSGNDVSDDPLIKQGHVLIEHGTSRRLVINTTYGRGMEFFIVATEV